MNIRKIIRVYFGFIMVLMAVSVLSINENFENHLISVFHVDTSKALKLSENSLWTMDFGQNLDDKYMKEDSNESVLLKIQGFNEKRFVSPGYDDSKVMKLSFTALEDLLLVKEIKFKIFGMNSKLLESVWIEKGNERIVGEIEGDSVVFKRLDLKVSAGTTKDITLMTSLSHLTHPGQRLRFDIESPEDIILFVANKRYSLSAYYPIKGDYLTVANVVAVE